MIKQARPLNPLAFTAETDGRFLILIFAAMSTAIIIAFFIGTFIFISRMVIIGEIIQQFEAITQEVGGGRALIQDLSDPELQYYYQQIQTPLQRLILLIWPWFLVILIIVGLMIGAAWLLYRHHPQLISWQFREQLRVTPLKPNNVLTKTVNDLATSVGITPAPIVVPHKISKEEIPMGQAYGFPGQYYLRLDAHLLALKKPKLFKALVLHELGHIANKDVERTNFAGALWLLQLATIIIIFTIIFLATNTFVPISMKGGISNLLFSLAAICYMSWGTWRSLVQIREFYADWRMAQWGDKRHWEQWLESARKWEKDEYKSWWHTYFPVHPSVDLRLEMLRNPLKLFRLNWQLPFYSGFLIAISSFGSLVLFAGFYILVFGSIYLKLARWGAALFSQPHPDNFATFATTNFFVQVLPTLCFIFAVLFGIGYLLTRTLGVQVQRETIADMSLGINQFDSYRQLVKPAMWLAAGVLAGNILTPLNFFLRSGLSTTISLGLWFGIFSVMMWLWLCILRALTWFLLGNHVGEKNPRRRKAVITIISSVSFTFLLPSAFFMFMLIIFSNGTAGTMIVGSNVLSPIIFNSISMIVLVLLALIYVVLFLAVLAVSYVVNSIRPNLACSSCGEQTPYKQALGNFCPYCEEPLALWIYTKRKAYV